MLKKDVFVFTDMVNAEGRISLDRDGSDDRYTLAYSFDGTVKTVHIDLSTIKDGNAAMVLYSPIVNSLIVHYGYSALCEAMNVTHSEFLKVASLYGFMQMDRYGNRVFIKVFLPKGQFCLDSDTDDYSDNAYLTADCVHPLDWQYIPTYDLVSVTVDEGDKPQLHMTLRVCRPAVEEAMGNMYINYAGQCQELHDGVNHINFRFVKGENAYIGYPYSRHKGRMIEVGRAVMR